MVTPDGEGEQGVYDLVARQKRRFNARLGIYRARDRHADISYSELWDISLIWVDAAALPSMARELVLFPRTPGRSEKVNKGLLACDAIQV